MIDETFLRGQIEKLFAEAFDSRVKAQLSRFTTLADVFEHLNSFDPASHPDLHLSPEQEQTILRFEQLSRVRRTRDLVRGLPSRGVTASNTRTRAS